jgi:gliding motility-associated-like protein
MRKYLYIITLCLVAFQYPLRAQIITTVTGIPGPRASTVDGYPANLSSIAIPNGIVKVPGGNLYISEKGAALIRIVTPDGILSSAAGSNVQGYSGDGGPALQAKIAFPGAMTADNAGNVYFIDQARAIRKISTNGIITTIAGEKELYGNSGDGGLLKNALFRSIVDICCDNAGNLYIVDQVSGVVRKANLTTGIINMFAGTIPGFSGDNGPAKNASLGWPSAVAADNAGNVYIADEANHRIRKVDAAGTITTIAGTGAEAISGDGGQATKAAFKSIMDLAVDNTGSYLYIAEENYGVRKIVLGNGTITRYAGNGTPGYSGDNGPPDQAQVNPSHLSVDGNGDLYISDYYSDVVRKVFCTVPLMTSALPADTAVCPGSTVQMNLTSLYTARYQWQLNTGTGWNDINNNAPYAGATTASLTITGTPIGMNNYQYRCNMVNNCSSLISPVTRLHITQTTPTIGITSSITNVCTGVSIVFKANTSNGGLAPVYQWKKNGINTGTNSNTYQTASLSKGDLITCTLTSNAPCALPVTVTSNTITMTGNAVTPAITIMEAKNNICAGTYVTFVAHPTNGGNTPAYQWKKNGVNTGINNASYIDNTLADGDVISCVLTSTSPCAVPVTATSNSIVMKVVTTIVPTIAIATSSTTLCPGTSLTFTTGITNGGAMPVYQWKKNGVNVGANSSTYTNNVWNNGDIITCVLTSNSTCAAPAPVTSNAITLTVNTGTPSVSIASNSTAATTCSGLPFQFYANTPIKGPSPVYQWKKNGSNVGTNSNSYMDNALVTGDVITCVFTHNVPCIAPATVTSNAVTMTVNPLLLPGISISTIAPDPCAGGPVTFKAAITDGGPAPVYLWKKNGAIVGTNSDTYVDNTVLNNGTSITCELQSQPCGFISGIVSDPIVIDCPCGSSGGIINKIAGTVSAPGFSPDGTPALSARLGNPYGIVVGKTNGNLYFSDYDNNRIRMINTAGNLVTIAGGGTGGDGPALNALLDHPADIITDNAGNIYFTDAGLKLRKVDPAGNLTTIIGNNPLGHSGDGGPVNLAKFGYIGDIAVDNAGNLYVAEPDSYIRKINTTTGIVTTIAGMAGPTGYTGDGGPATSALIDRPKGLVVDNGGNLYFSTSLNCIRKINAAGIITTIAGSPARYNSGDGGPATAAGFNAIFDLAIDDAGNLYVSDIGLGLIRKIGTDGIINHFAGNMNFFYSGDGGPAEVAGINPVCLAVGPDAVYFTESAYTVIRKIACPLVTIDRQPADALFCTTGDASFSIKACNAANYQWQLNTGSGWANITNNTTYAGATADVLLITGANAGMNNYQYRCLASKSCGFVLSVAATLRAGSAVASTVSIAPSATTVCAGANVVFTATATNPGTLPIYQWLKNGVPVGVNSITYTDNSLISGDLVSCKLTTSNPCATPAIAVSNNIMMTVTSPLTPTISIIASAATVCEGASVTFTATGINTGSLPVYQWKKNGLAAGTNNATYTDNTLSNGDIVFCTLTSNADCAVTTSAISNFITTTVTPVLVPGLTIAASANSICAGTPVTFTAASTNVGTAPVYQWKKNEMNVGTNNPVYTDNTLNNGDIISCTLTSTAACTLPATAGSNNILMTVNASIVPSLVIATPTYHVCTGIPITFTATANNGGTAPAYQWKKNGLNVGTNNTTYTSNALNNGDQITCVLTSNAACAATPTATSNTVVVSLNPPATSSVVVGASDNNICKGTSIRFTAAITNGGAAPIYQWKKNGFDVGANSSAYTDNTLNNGDLISCVLTPDIPCTVSPTVISNKVSMILIQTLNPAITIAGSANPLCAGADVFFIATDNNGGAAPGYQWKINGVPTGSNTRFYSSNTLSDKDIITCELLTGYTCAAPATGVSNAITMTILPVQAPVVTISTASNSICPGEAVTFTAAVANNGTSTVYQWQKNGLKVGANAPSYANNTLIAGDLISCTITTTTTCLGTIGANSNTVAIALKDCIKDLILPNAFSPNHDGKNDIFKATLPANVKQFQLQVFNRWGNLVFQTTNPLQGWDGTFNGKETGTAIFVWMCKYQLEGEPVKTAKGTVALIR